MNGRPGIDYSASSRNRLFCLVSSKEKCIYIPSRIIKTYKWVAPLVRELLARHPCCLHFLLDRTLLRELIELPGQPRRTILELEESQLQLAAKFKFQGVSISIHDTRVRVHDRPRTPPAYPGIATPAQWPCRARHLHRTPRRVLPTGRRR